MIDQNLTLVQPLDPTSQIPETKQVRYRSEINRLSAEDRSAHDWYRFVLSYPPHLVRDYLQRFGMDHTHRVLDPFCGTGTTLV
ncbi:MAG: hypothetical protein VKJ46_16230, partial [Leptolyngbyaceae bacterium]|nr:hypothetical protein [Leptolyngbyaceae bacterium]